MSSLSDSDRRAPETYSSEEMGALELRRKLGGAAFGNVLLLLQIERARSWMFPMHVPESCADPGESRLTLDGDKPS